MMQDEVKNTTLIGLSGILLGALLTFIVFLFVVRSELADARNHQILAAQEMKSYREFNKYAEDTLFGEDVVAAIRDYYDSGIRIRVNMASSFYYVDKYVAQQTPSMVDIPYLYSLFPTTKKYKAVLVYGNVDLATVTQSWNDRSSAGVNAIVFFEIGLR